MSRARTPDALRDQLERIDGRGYKAYKGIRGSVDFGDFELDVVYVQGDPFAAPSRLTVHVPARTAALPEWVLAEPARRVGAADRIVRRFAAAARRASGSDGSGRSGQVAIDAPGQEMLERTAGEVDEDGRVTLRFTVGLPARGRRVMGRAAARLLCERLPEAVRRAVDELAGDEALRAHAAACEDQRALREQLAGRGLVGFVADDALLPRRSGVDDRPMEGGGVVRWEGPESLRVTLQAPNAGPVVGTGVPRGVTLICGGGYHGKSTVLEALSRGVYDHVPGDGREQVVTLSTAAKIRAEDGRAVAGVDISPFIDGLPGGRDTRRFSTADASGSTSQAAALVEALELGAKALLLDEDTCATNFMIRDRRMQALVEPEREPITPLVDRLAAMRDELGVSFVLVMGGSGDYFDVADTVLVMDAYRPRDATDRARAIAAELPTGRASEATGPFPTLSPRIPDPGSFDPSRGRRAVKVRGRATRAIEFGRETIEIAALEQLVDASQTRTIGDAIVVALEHGLIDGHRSLREVVEALAERQREWGPLAFAARGEGDRAAVRPLEIGFAVNRLRTLGVC